MTEIEQSEEAQARIRPCSSGAQQIELTDNSCVNSKILVHELVEVSFQMKILRSYEQEAMTEPNFG